MQAADYASLFRTEIERSAAEFSGEAQAIVEGPAGSDALAGTIEVYCGQIGRAQETALMLGLAGLAAAAEVIAANVRALAQADPPARAAAMTHLRAWPAAFVAYLDGMTQPQAASDLAAFLSVDSIPAPVDAAGAASLVALLADGVLALQALGASEPDESEPPVIEERDLVVGIPQDCDDRVRESFLAESPLLAERLIELAHLVVAGTADAGERQAAKRFAHSLKGSASIVGSRAIVTVAHALEDLLDLLVARTDPPGEALGGLLLDGASVLAQLVGALCGTEPLPEEVDTVARLLRESAWLAQREGLEAADALLGPSPPGHGRTAARAVIDDSTGTAEDPAAAGGPSAGSGHPPTTAPSTRPSAGGASVQPAVSAANAETAALRVPVATVDELFRLLGELGTRVVRLQSEVRDARAEARALRNSLDGVEVFRDGVLGPIFDALDTASRGVDERLAALAAESVHHERIQRELGRLVLSTRMLPVATLVPRLKRTLRQTCRQTGKDADLRVTGEHILVDGDMLEALADPLLHLLRNAVDHGIESPEDRARIGKSSAGVVDVIFSRRGPVVSVLLRDDGRGLDYERIEAKAIERGLVPPGARLSRAELARLTLQPGFSTRSEVSEISGRGVGMDVVQERLTSMKGSVDIASEPGQGCAVTLRFQATLVSQHALIVTAGGELLAVPSHLVEIALAPGMAEFLRVDGWPAAFYHGETWRLYSLGALAGFGDDPVSADTVQTRPLVLIRDGDRRVALVCDRLIDGRELVVKAVGRYLRRVPALAGTVILASGRVAPVVDVAELIRTQVARERATDLAASAAGQRVA